MLEWGGGISPGFVMDVQLTGTDNIVRWTFSHAIATLSDTGGLTIDGASGSQVGGGVGFTYIDIEYFGFASAGAVWYFDPDYSGITFNDRTTGPDSGVVGF